MPRPALADVLAVTASSGEGWWGVDYTTTDCEQCEDPPHRRGRISCEAGGVRWQLPVHAYHRAGPDSPEWYEGVVLPWSCATPAEAIEVLHTRGLWPWAPGDPRAPRWWCEGCEGKGSVPVDTARGRRAIMCGECDDHAPPSFPTLVAVASLGVAALARAAAIVAETWPGARLVWRCESSETLREHHDSKRFEAQGFPVVLAPLFSYMAHHWSDAMWPERSPVSLDARGEAAWHALVALRGLDLHLLACGDGHVVLGVEDIP